MRRLFSDMESYLERIAIVDSDGEEVTYQALLELSDQQMEEIDDEPCLIAIESGNSILPLATYVGAMRRGHAVILAPPEGLGGQSRIRQTFSPRFVFTNREGRFSLEKDFAAPKQKLHVDLAVMLSTSGSTGSPKLIRLSHKNLVANAESISEYLKISSDERAAMTLPWSYSYGLSIVNSHLLNGATLLLPEHSVTDSSFWDYFSRNRATSFPGVPHTYELLEQSGFLEKNLPTLRYFTQAGGKLGEDKVSLFAQYAQRHDKRFFVMYGQTEASPRIAYLSPEMTLRFPTCIGRPIPGGTLKLVDHNGVDIEETDTEGELIYSGPNVMMSYATSPEDLLLGHEVEELRTGDIAIKNSDNLYKIVGRLNRFSKLSGHRISLDDIENLLKNDGIPSAVSGDDTMVVVATNKARQKEKIGELIVGKFNLPPSALCVVELLELPRLSSGKMDYPSIMQMGRDERSAAVTGGEITLRDEIIKILGSEVFDENESFVTMGGDSLNYIQMALMLESRLGLTPKGWEAMTVTELEAIGETESKWFNWVEIDIFLRSIAIILVVIHHVTMLPMRGAAASLLVVAGYNFARFQVPRLITKSFYTVVRPLLVSIIPLYFAVITIFFIYKREMFLPQYLLVSNFTKGFYIDGTRYLVTWWFIECYIWLILLFTLLFKSQLIRDYARRVPWGFSCIMLIVTIITRWLGLIFPDFNLFFHDSPLMFANLFMIGWCAHTASTPTARLASWVLALMVIIFLTSGTVYTSGVSLICVTLLFWIPTIPMEKWTGKALSYISMASFFIYLTHGFVLMPVRLVAGGLILPTSYWVPVTFLCLLAGVIVNKLINNYWQRA